MSATVYANCRSFKLVVNLWGGNILNLSRRESVIGVAMAFPLLWSTSFDIFTTSIIVSE